MYVYQGKVWEVHVPICIKNGLKILLAKQNDAGEIYTLKTQNRRFCFRKSVWSSIMVAGMPMLTEPKCWFYSSLAVLVKWAAHMEPSEKVSVSRMLWAPASVEERQLIFCQSTFICLNGGGWGWEKKYFLFQYLHNILRAGDGYCFKKISIWQRHMVSWHVEGV